MPAPAWGEVSVDTVTGEATGEGLALELYEAKLARVAANTGVPHNSGRVAALRGFAAEASAEAEAIHAHVDALLT